MNPVEIVVLLATVAAVTQITRRWPKIAGVTIALATFVLIVNVANASTNSIDVLSVSLAQDPASRDFVAVGLLLTAALALATIFRRDRVSLSFLYWSWPAWYVAFVVNDFVVAVFAWTLGLIIAVFGMKPRKHHRASGAASYLVVVVLSAVSLLLANRFVILYPETPERTELIQFAVLFLCWGFGLAFALFPFQFWVGPMTDDAPLPTAAAILALGQPIGLVLLFRFLNQNLWLVEKADIFQLMQLGGILATIFGGLLAAVERRAGRLLGYAAIFAFGFALLDLSRASPEGLAYSALEMLARAVGLTLLASAVTIGRGVENPAVRRVSQAAVLLAGLDLVGLRLGVSLDERWNVFLQLAGSDLRFLAIILLAHAGVLVGVVRFSRDWFELEPGRVEVRLESLEAMEREPAVEVERVQAAQGRPSLLLRAEYLLGGNGQELAGPAGEDIASGEAQGPSKVKGIVQPIGNGNGEDNGREELGKSPEEYVFEDHVREIVKTLVERARPYLRRASQSLPAGTRALLVVIWTSWRVWVGIGLLAALIAVLLAVGLVPGAWFDRAVATLGHPPLVQ